tara:strand:- start:1526 stop:1843 length:318 start_codon:yes stop_codon:yes gene_type:complete
MSSKCPNPNHVGVIPDHRTGVLRCATCEAWIRELRADEYIGRKHKRYASYRKALKRLKSYEDERELQELIRARAEQKAHERQMAAEFPDQAESDLALEIDSAKLQ